MLSTLELVINGFVALVVLPLALVSLATGSKPPEHGFLARLYGAQKHLMPIGNLFLSVLGATAANRLAERLGFIDAARGEAIGNWLMVPFLVLLAIFLAFLIKAWLAVRRARNAG